MRIFDFRDISSVLAWDSAQCPVLSWCDPFCFDTVRWWETLMFCKWQGHAEVLATNAFCPQFMTSDVDIINLVINNTEQPLTGLVEINLPKERHQMLFKCEKKCLREECKITIPVF